MGRRKIFAGNWKMYKTYSEAVELVKGLTAGLKKNEEREYVLFPPSPYLREISSLCPVYTVCNRGPEYALRKPGCFHGRGFTFNGKGLRSLFYTYRSFRKKTCLS